MSEKTINKTEKLIGENKMNEYPNPYFSSKEDERSYLEKQIDEIFENERWIEKSKNDLDKLKDIGANSK